MNTKIGRYSYLSNNCEFYYTSIGAFSCIANDVKLIRGQHPTQKFVSVSPLFFQSTTCFGYSFSKSNLFKLNKCTDSGTLCNIGNDVWIGSHVRIMEGVEIGNGAIIGAGAVVTKDVPPYSICVGVPAKVIKYRFCEEDISMLEKIQWWSWSESRLKANVDFFKDVSLLREAIDSNVINGS